MIKKPPNPHSFGASVQNLGQIIIPGSSTPSTPSHPQGFRLLHWFQPRCLENLQGLLPLPSLLTCRDGCAETDHVRTHLEPGRITTRRLNGGGLLLDPTWRFLRSWRIPPWVSQFTKMVQFRLIYPLGHCHLPETLAIERNQRRFGGFHK